MKKLMAVTVALVVHAVSAGVAGQEGLKPIIGFMGEVTPSGATRTRVALDDKAPAFITGARVEQDAKSAAAGSLRAAFVLSLHNRSDKTITKAFWILNTFNSRTLRFDFTRRLAGAAQIPPGQAGTATSVYAWVSRDESLLVQLSRVEFDDGTAWDNPSLIDLGDGGMPILTGWTRDTTPTPF